MSSQSQSQSLSETLSLSKNILSLTALVAAYAGKASLGRFRLRDHNKRLCFYTKNVSTYCKKALEQFNVQVEVIGFQPELMREKNFLLVGNHLSYLDIMVLASVQPCVFVTSVDLGETAFLGQMAEMGGSLFVERRHRGTIGRDVGVMADTLRAGHNVVIYPEGTSSNGEKVLPFKRSLLASAMDAEVDVLPVVIKYTEIDGEPFAIKNRDRVCWYGDMGFVPHSLGLLAGIKIKAELHFLGPIKVTKDTDRHQLADLCHKVISDVYGHPLSQQSQQ